MRSVGLLALLLLSHTVSQAAPIANRQNAEMPPSGPKPEDPWGWPPPEETQYLEDPPEEPPVNPSLPSLQPSLKPPPPEKFSTKPKAVETTKTSTLSKVTSERSTEAPKLSTVTVPLSTSTLHLPKVTPSMSTVFETLSAVTTDVSTVTQDLSSKETPPLSTTAQSMSKATPELGVRNPNRPTTAPILSHQGFPVGGIIISVLAGIALITLIAVIVGMNSTIKPAAIQANVQADEQPVQAAGPVLGGAAVIPPGPGPGVPLENMDAVLLHEVVDEMGPGVAPYIAPDPMFDQLAPITMEHDVIHIMQDECDTAPPVLTTSTPLQKRLQKEFQQLATEPPIGVQLDVECSTLLKSWMVDIDGAEKTVYEAEKFRLQFTFCDQYPFSPPEVVFIGNIPLHPQIYSNGHICLSILTDDWMPTLSVPSVCLSIVEMLSACKEKKRPANNSLYLRKCFLNPKKTW